MCVQQLGTLQLASILWGTDLFFLQHALTLPQWCGKPSRRRERGLEQEQWILRDALPQIVCHSQLPKSQGISMITWKLKDSVGPGVLLLVLPCPARTKESPASLFLVLTHASLRAHHKGALG